MSDRIKILSHLKMRDGWVADGELRSTWKFEDYDAALESLKKEKMVEGSNMYKIRIEGLKALKEGTC